MRIDAPAKLNLCLFLGSRREDGLHSLCSLFEPLALADSIEVSEVERDEIVAVLDDRERPRRTRQAGDTHEVAERYDFARLPASL